MRRECRKPYEMKAREYANHLVRINTEEIPFIPPAAADQELSNDELIDILLFGTPKSWQQEMDRQGFDPLDNTIQAVVAFMERIEESEDPQMRDKKPSAVSNSNGKKPASKDWKAQGKTGTKNCMLHGNGSHTTEECKTLQAQTKRLKGDRSPDAQGSSGKKAYGNKTWTKKADDGKRDSRKELNAIVKKAIAKGVREELNAIQSKRKSDDSSDEEGELNLLEGKFDLSDFNYKEMDNLKITDPDEVSV
jgi:hypothetical protein